jgi:hypothetical protein
MPGKLSLSILSLALVVSISAGCGGGASGSGATGAATLSWDAPATRTDGSSLNPSTALQSYKIYYGTSPHAYTQSVNVPNPGTATITHTVSLSPGTYYFAVTAIDAYGQESGYSTEVSKTI